MKDTLQTEASRLGFDLCRVAAAGPAPHAADLEEWLRRGYHGAMEWMARTASLRSDPRRILPGARSVIVLATNYYRGKTTSGRGVGKIARYAHGNDYHTVLGSRMESLDAFLIGAGGEQRCFVDGGPVLERDWAAAAGLSWHGKSTMGIHPQLGTWFFISVILTTLELEPDSPLPDRCGRCTRCIDACPTNAIKAPYTLDARRCISYLTIENRGPIPEEFREAIGARIFGCDDCLEVCPWNRFARASREAKFAPAPGVLETPMREFLSLDDTAFKALFANSPILRAKRRGFLRNVCVGLGNEGKEEDLPALRQACQDSDGLVSEHARWAVSRITAREKAAHQPRCSKESR